MSRIAFVLPNLGGGGAERVALTLIQGFLDRGHQVDLILVEAKGELLPLVPAGVQVFDLCARRMRSALWPFVKYLRDRKPDAIQASMWPVTIVAILARAAAKSHARLVISEHTILSEAYAGWGWLHRFVLRGSIRAIYPLADGRVVVSRQAADDIASLAGLDRNSMEVIYNPVHFPATIRSDSRIETLWGSRAPRVITVGSLKAAKNHALLIRAFAQSESQTAGLMIVGEGPLRADLEHLTSQLGIADRVIFAGFSIDPWPYLASADLFVLSSEREGFPVAVVEAMLAGLPVVSTDCISGPGEILEGGRYGRLVPCGNAVALAGAIDAALVGPHDCDAGRTKVRQLSSDAIERYEKLLLGAGG